MNARRRNLTPNSRASHIDGTVQITMTFVCAYLSYITAEGVMAEIHVGVYLDKLGFSGVVAAVVSGITLASQVWPSVVQPESMKTVWHTVEFSANTLLFLLAGTMQGELMYVKGKEGELIF